MAKRFLMVMLFVGALGAASLVAPQSAEARHRCYGGGYGYAPVYSTYYGGGFYAPRVYHGHGFHGHRNFYRGGGVGIYGHRGGLYIGW